KRIDNVFVLPRSALQANEQVYVISDDNRLQFRDVEIIRIVNEDVYVTSGFERGETISLSTVNNAIEGMLVIPVNDAGLATS
ncbi:MAG: hypothetical protein O3C68_00865, partial [Proteobacteria bacterium]|nr:hypothetical protein [Pseudomonadota bacterium]